MTDWLRDIPVYKDLNQIAERMSEAVKADREEYEMCERDTVLAGLVCYLATTHVNPILKEPILQIVDVYCGKPIEQGEKE